jgi:hypothetical protein
MTAGSGDGGEQALAERAVVLDSGALRAADAHGRDHVAGYIHDGGPLPTVRVRYMKLSVVLIGLRLSI